MNDKVDNSARQSFMSDMLCMGAALNLCEHAGTEAQENPEVKKLLDIILETTPERILCTAAMEKYTQLKGGLRQEHLMSFMSGKTSQDKSLLKLLLPDVPDIVYPLHLTGNERFVGTKAGIGMEYGGMDPLVRSLRGGHSALMYLDSLGFFPSTRVTISYPVEVGEYSPKSKVKGRNRGNDWNRRIFKSGKKAPNPSSLLLGLVSGLRVKR